MLKTLFAGFTLFILMVGTAVIVSRTVSQTADGQFGQYGSSGSYGQSGAAHIPEAGGGSYLEAQNSPVRTNGSSGGIEDNPFVIALGLTVILCLAIGFWKHHQIHEERRIAQEAAAAAKRKAARFKYGGGKEQPV